MKKTFAILLLFICAGQHSYALKFQSGDDVTISNPVYEDLYIAGGTLVINAPVYADLIIAGGTLTINDSVSGDLIIAGGNIIINGGIGDDIRCAGGDINIKSSVAGDLVVAGGKVKTDRQSVIYGDVLAGAGTLNIYGTIKGNLSSGSGELYLDGIIEKDIDCRAEKIEIKGTISGKSKIAAQDIIIGSGAAFNNDVRYWSPEKNVNFGQSVKNGSAVYDSSLAIERDHWYYLGFSVFFAAFWYLAAAFIFIFLVQYLFGSTMKSAANRVFESTGKSFGYGVLFFLLVPLAAVILCITIIGIPLGLLVLMAYGVLALLASVISAVVIANWFNNRRNKHWKNIHISLVALLSFIVLKLVSFIPFLGWVFMFITAGIAFGSIIITVREGRAAGNKRTDNGF